MYLSCPCRCFTIEACQSLRYEAIGALYQTALVSSVVRNDLSELSEPSTFKKMQLQYNRGVLVSSDVVVSRSPVGLCWAVSQQTGRLRKNT